MASGTDYTEVVFATKNEAEKDILLAQLTHLGFEGFEEDKNLLKAFIASGDFDESLIRQVVDKSGIEYSCAEIKYKNWNEAWESGFEPVIVSNFCAIRATFHKPVIGVQYDVIITPKMSFGTGHHATTYLMIEAMKNIVIQNKAVFDFGTGTGVLAILAEKMGASVIEAIDVDDWSIENGRENLDQNNCTKVHLYKSDRIDPSRKFDVILANINRNVILSNLSSMKEHLLPGGVLVLSGLLAGDEAIVAGEAARINMRLFSIQERNSWIVIQFVIKQD